jgi:outer membrane protein TolC
VSSLALAQPAVPPAEEPKLTELRDAPKEDDAAQVLQPSAGGLTADAVGRRTISNSHTVKARLAELDAARAKLNQTTAQFLPRLTLRAAYTRLSPVSSGFGTGALVGAQNPGLLQTGPCPTGVGTCVLDSQGQPVGAAAFSIESLDDAYSLSATLNVPISDYVLRLSNAAKGASASRRAAELQVKAEKLKVKTDAQALYYDWLRAKARVAIAEKSLERTRARVKDARPAYELGTITKADLMRLEALAANTEQIVVEATTYRNLAERQLAIVMGYKTPRSFAVGEDVSVAPRALGGGLETLTNEAVANRIELRALSETERALKLGAKALDSGKWPRLDAFGEATYANPNARYFPQRREWNATWAVGIAATWTVGDTFLNSAAASEVEANARALSAQRSALADGIRQEVAAHYLGRERSSGALKAARRSVAASEEAYRVAVELYRVGKATTTELIDAETDLLSARLNEINARIELRISEVRLRHAVGRDIGR